ncbi:hypothetical protein DFJ73DRAFT_788926 [Zopfochytrium polystomum]|nr:hypothetical protein DFJ73DRAFT_788926 [Zopfochytrium polystomum]
MSSGPAIIVTGFSVELKRADIRTLRNGQWLNDEIINFYGELIMERAKNTPKLPQLHYFNTFFLPTLRDQGYSMVRRWTRKFDLFAKELVIIPVHLGMHWCCSIINFKKKRIEYYDSLHGSYNIIFKVLRDYLASESMDKKKKPFDFEGWTDYAPKSIPAQRNGYDCGVFTCMFAEFSSRQAPFTFTQIDMPDLRNRIASEIINKKLMV